MSELKKINIRGINIANSDIDVPDGSCQEIINMRYKDGSWRPAGDVSSDWTLDYAGWILHKHPVLSTDKFICYDSRFDKIYVIDMTAQSSRKEILDITGETLDYLHHFNNVLFVVTDVSKYVFIYDESYITNISGTNYRKLEYDKIPMGQTYLTQVVTLETTATYSTYLKAMTALVEALEIHKKANKSYEGELMVRYAYKLFDGTYIKHSLPLYARISHDSDCKVETTSTTFGISNYPIGNVYANIIFSTAGLAEILKWKSIIMSLDIFVYHRDLYDYTDDDYIQPAAGTLIVAMHGYEKTENLLEVSNYYRIASIELDELVASNSKKLEIEGELQSNELLPVDSFSHHDHWGDVAYNFNSRIHFGYIKQKLFEGYSQLTINDDTDWETYFLPTGYSRGALGTLTLYMIVDIDTIEGSYRMIHEIPYYYPYIKAANPNILVFNHVYGYPDSRAISMALVSYDGANYKFMGNYPLEAHPILNYAYHSGLDIYGKAKTVEETSGTIIGGMYTENRVQIDKNRIQLSDIDNPFIYPAKNSYRISDSNCEIRVLSSIVNVISEGQYGQFPLYVLTSIGIWLMEQGEGEIVYKTIHPLSKKVITNNNSYVQIEGGIVFSAEKSVYIMSGRTIKSISDIIEGIPASYLVGYSAYDDKINDSDLVELSTIISTIDFRTYLASAIFCYNAYEKELIVSNASKTYSYIYAFETGVWSKIDKIYSQFVNVDPSVYAIDDAGKGYDLYDALVYDEYQHCLIQTRPIKLDSTGFKKFERIYAEMKATIKSNTRLGFYIYGSIDGYEWKILKGIQTPGAKQPAVIKLSNLILGRVHTSIRYAIILITCQTKLAEIRGLDIQFENIYNRKLR